MASVGSVYAGLCVSDGTQSCISVDGLLALIVANIQNIYTNIPIGNLYQQIGNTAKIQFDQTLETSVFKV